MVTRVCKNQYYMYWFLQVGVLYTHAHEPNTYVYLYIHIVLAKADVVA